MEGHVPPPRAVHWSFTTISQPVTRPQVVACWPGLTRQPEPISDRVTYATAIVSPGLYDTVLGTTAGHQDAAGPSLAGSGSLQYTHTAVQCTSSPPHHPLLPHPPSTAPAAVRLAIRAGTRTTSPQLTELPPPACYGYTPGAQLPCRPHTSLPCRCAVVRWEP